MDGEDLIRAFGKELGLELEPDDSGSCAFSSDGITLTLTALREADCVAFTADLGALPPERPDNLYRLMLESNHLFNATGGATLSLDSDSGHAALCRVFPCAAADADSFYAAVERFANAAESWAKIIADYRFSAADAEDGPGADMPPAGSFLRV